MAILILYWAFFGIIVSLLMLAILVENFLDKKNKFFRPAEYQDILESKEQLIRSNSLEREIWEHRCNNLKKS